MIPNTDSRITDFKDDVDLLMNMEFREAFIYAVMRRDVAVPVVEGKKKIDLLVDMVKQYLDGATIIIRGEVTIIDTTMSKRIVHSKRRYNVETYDLANFVGTWYYLADHNNIDWSFAKSVICNSVASLPDDLVIEAGGNLRYTYERIYSEVGIYDDEYELEPSIMNHRYEEAPEDIELVKRESPPQVIDICKKCVNNSVMPEMRLELVAKKSDVLNKIKSSTQMMVDEFYAHASPLGEYVKARDTILVNAIPVGICGLLVMYDERIEFVSRADKVYDIPHTSGFVHRYDLTGLHIMTCTVVGSRLVSESTVYIEDLVFSSQKSIKLSQYGDRKHWIEHILTVVNEPKLRLLPTLDTDQEAYSLSNRIFMKLPLVGLRFRDNGMRPCETYKFGYLWSRNWYFLVKVGSGGAVFMRELEIKNGKPVSAEVVVGKLHNWEFWYCMADKLRGASLTFFAEVQALGEGLFGFHRFRNDVNKPDIVSKFEVFKKTAMQLLCSPWGVPFDIDDTASDIMKTYYTLLNVVREGKKFDYELMFTTINLEHVVTKEYLDHLLCVSDMLKVHDIKNSKWYFCTRADLE